LFAYDKNIFCEFNIYFNNFKFFQNFTKIKKKKDQKSYLIPFWIGKILNISSFCSIKYPKFLNKKLLKKIIINPFYFNVSDFSKEFYFLGIKIAKILKNTILKKLLKKIFHKKLSKIIDVLLYEIQFSNFYLKRNKFFEF
jgi:hypothetical protein